MVSWGDGLRVAVGLVSWGMVSWGMVAGAKQARPMTSRASDALDLVATIRLSAGDDLTRNSASEQLERRQKCLNLYPSRGNSG